MSAAFTPQAWEPKGLQVTAAGRGMIATCPSPQNGGVTECVANANLIAAAPDMFEAIERALPLIQVDRDALVECHTFPFGDLATLDPDVKPDVDEYDAALIAMRTALAKARGE